MKFYIIYCILQFMGRVQIGFGVGNPEEIISCGFDNKTLVGRTAQWVAGQLSGWQDSLVGGRTAQWVAGQLSGWQDSSEVEGLHAITTASCCGLEPFTYSQLLPLTRTILMQTTFQVHQSNWINCQLPANYLSVTCQYYTFRLDSESIMRIVSCQSAPVLYYSFLEHSLLIWILTPDKGLARLAVT